MLIAMLRRALACVVIVGAAASAQDLPTPESLAARHDSLIGGRVALEGHQSMRMTGTFAIPEMGLDAPLTILKRRPNQYVMRAALGQMGELLSGYDGTNAWSVQPGAGAVLMQGEAATQIARQADFFGDLHDFTRFTAVETMPAEDLGGRKVWPVRMIRPSGDTIVELYDAGTGLSAGSRVNVKTPQGTIEASSIVSDYRDFGGLKVATRIEQRVPQYRVVITILTVDFDALSEADLAPPESVRALIKP